MQLLGKFINEFTFQYDFQESRGFQEAFNCMNGSQMTMKRVDLYKKLDGILKLGLFRINQEEFHETIESMKYLG